MLCELVPRKRWKQRGYWHCPKWVDLFTRAIRRETGFDDWPDIEVHWTDNPETDLWRIRMVIEKPHRCEIEVVVDRGDEDHSEFFREVRLTYELHRWVPCRLWVKDGEWEGLCDITQKFNWYGPLRELVEELSPRRSPLPPVETPGPLIPANHRGLSDRVKPTANRAKPGANLFDPTGKHSAETTTRSGKHTSTLSATEAAGLYGVAEPEYRPPAAERGHREYAYRLGNEPFTPSTTGGVRFPEGYFRVQPPRYGPMPEAKEPEPVGIWRPMPFPVSDSGSDADRQRDSFIRKRTVTDHPFFAGTPEQRGRKRKTESTALERLAAVKTTILIEPRTTKRSVMTMVMAPGNGRLRLAEMLKLATVTEEAIRFRLPLKRDRPLTLRQLQSERWRTLPWSRRSDWNLIVDLYGGDWRHNDYCWVRKPWEGTSEEIAKMIAWRSAGWKLDMWGRWVRKPKPEPRRKRDPIAWTVNIS